VAEEKTYQPKWEEHKERKHHRRHHHHTSNSSTHTNTWGGWMKMKDKQAYYGLMLIVIAGLAFGAYKVVMAFVHEFRAMPMDDPKTEMKVDELDIRRVEKNEALQASDSIAQSYQLDSTTIKRVQTESHHVYRPPRRENEWYITQREWKDIWRNMKRWKQAKKNDEKLNEKQ
jgi:hypothetical protein